MQRLGAWYLMKLITDKIPHEDTTVDCRFNAANFITILHMILRWQQQNMK